MPSSKSACAAWGGELKMAEFGGFSLHKFRTKWEDSKNESCRHRCKPQVDGVTDQKRLKQKSIKFGLCRQSKSSSTRWPLARSSLWPTSIGYVWSGKFCELTLHSVTRKAQCITRVLLVSVFLHSPSRVLFTCGKAKEWTKAEGTQPNMAAHVQGSTCIFLSKFLCALFWN